jgi:hypothetical protein
MTESHCTSEFWLKRVYGGLGRKGGAPEGAISNSRAAWCRRRHRHRHRIVTFDAMQYC